MSPVLVLDSAGASALEIGGKARNLARLRAAGLPVPRGLVIPAEALRGDWRSELIAASGELRAPLAVRSSASIEDRSAGAAPGLFRSRLDVSHDALEEAVAEVAASVGAPSVRSYCQLRGIDEDAVAIAVVIQEQITPARCRGVLYTRAPGRPDEDLVAVDVSAEGAFWSGERRRTPAVGEADPPPALSRELWSELLRAALAAEGAIGATAGADVEWVIDDGGRPWLVQARPIVHPPPSQRPEPSLFQFSRGDSTLWTWDVTHNPDPLSPAQAGLVRRALDVGVGVQMRIVSGYLYSAPLPDPPEPAPLPPEPGALGRFFTDEIVPLVDAELGALEHPGPRRPSPADELERALEAYGRVVALYGKTLSPTLRAARRPLRDWLRARVGEPRAGELMAALLATRSDRHLAAWIRRVAHGQDELESLLDYAGPMSPAWDVAAPTFAEDPGFIERAVQAERAASSSRPDDTREASAQAIRLRASLTESEEQHFDRLLARAREAHELGETDDHVFFRAQAVVRRALLGVAEMWSLEPRGDIFFVDPDRVLAHARDGAPPAGLEGAVGSARARRREQQALDMPREIQDGRGLYELAPGNAGGWRGVMGCSGRARGKVLKLRDLGSMSASPEGRVILARAISPSLLFRIHGAAALISIYGGPLGHGAAMARELGIPCVVQCRGAWEALADGDEVWVDGESGLVVRALGARAHLTPPRG